MHIKVDMWVDVDPTLVEELFDEARRCCRDNWGCDFDLESMPTEDSLAERIRHAVDFIIEKPSDQLEPFGLTVADCYTELFDYPPEYDDIQDI